MNKRPDGERVDGPIAAPGAASQLLLVLQPASQLKSSEQLKP